MISAIESLSLIPPIVYIYYKITYGNKEHLPHLISPFSTWAAYFEDKTYVLN